MNRSPTAKQGKSFHRYSIPQKKRKPSEKDGFHVHRNSSTHSRRQHPRGFRRELLFEEDRYILASKNIFANLLLRQGNPALFVGEVEDETKYHPHGQADERGRADTSRRTGYQQKQDAHDGGNRTHSAAEKLDRLAIHTGTAQNVKSFIDCNIYRKINAELVAEKFRFSVSQLSRLFKREYGATVYNYILEQKIATAEKLLQNSSLTVKQIADMLNFTDEHYFCNIFKKKRGVTPGRIRK